MGRYGKDMRDCCDSLARKDTPHIRGCVHYVVAGEAVEERDEMADHHLRRIMSRIAREA